MTEACANPLLLSWLKESLDTAREHSHKTATAYKKAYESLKNYPVTLSHPSEAQQLNGFGPKICEGLTKKLEEHCRANGLPAPIKTRGRKRPSVDPPADAQDEDGSAAAPAKKARKPKQYVPAHRSGAYALIIALATLPRDSMQSLTKAELQEIAQPHSDSSFTAPSDPTKFYTAWNSMNTLVDKWLVHESGRPTRRYALTDEGWELADKMQAVGKGPQVNTKQTSDEPSEERPAVTRPKSLVSETAMNRSLSSHDQSHHHGLDSSPADAVRSHWARKEVSNITQTQVDRPIEQGEGRKSTREPESATSGANVVDLMWSPERPPVRTKISERSTTTDRTHQDSARTGPGAATQLRAVPKLPDFRPVVLSPGSFTVRLVLDTREVRAKTDRDYVAEQLEKKGISPIMRALELGDFFWVAKVNDPDLLASHREDGDEVALDWIIERKRLDDLVGSLTDGRFHEQKFRLHRSGAKNVVYLIEAYSISEEKQSRFHESIRTAIASTQVVNGFFVKQTSKIDDTIRYITRMTIMLKSLYESKPLHVIPSRVITTENYLPLLKHFRSNPVHSHHVTYDTFASLCSKSDALTLRDMHLKMLMCTRGIGSEKALALQKVWPTPRNFVEAFQECEDLKAKECLIESKLGHLVGRGKIKGVLSAKVADIWGVE